MRDGCDHKVWAAVGVAEDVADEGLVDAHAVLHENDGGVRSEPWEKCTDGINGVVRLDTYNKGLDGGRFRRRGLDFVVKGFVLEPGLGYDNAIPFQQDSRRRVDGVGGIFCALMDESDRVVL